MSAIKGIAPTVYQAFYAWSRSWPAWFSTTICVVKPCWAMYSSYSNPGLSCSREDVCRLRKLSRTFRVATDRLQVSLTENDRCRSSWLKLELLQSSLLQSGEGDRRCDASDLEDARESRFTPMSPHGKSRHGRPSTPLDASLHYR